MLRRELLLDVGDVRDVLVREGDVLLRDLLNVLVDHVHIFPGVLVEPFD